MVVVRDEARDMYNYVTAPTALRWDGGENLSSTWTRDRGYVCCEAARVTVSLPGGLRVERGKRRLLGVRGLEHPGVHGLATGLGRYGAQGPADC